MGICRPSRGIFIAVLLGILSFPLDSATADVRYGVKDLGSLGGTRAGGLGLNATGIVVGYSDLPGTTTLHGFLNDGGGIRDLGTFGGDQSVARSINRNEEVVGWAVTETGERHAFVLRGSTLLDLGTLGSSPVDAWAINDAGEIVGSYMNGSAERAYVWRSGMMEDLGTLGGTDSRAYSINNQGDIVGFARPIPNDELHACLWRGGTILDLGTLGGWASHAYDINDNGKIVGWSMMEPNYISHAFEWVDGVMYDLGTLGGVYSAAFAINNFGDVVGTATLASGEQHAIVFSGAQLIDLNSLIPAEAGWRLVSAQDINDQGLIVGVGVYNGEYRGFLLAPTAGLSAELQMASREVEFAGATPNPLFGAGRFGFSLPVAGHARLRLFDLSGRAVRTLADREFAAGASSLAFDGRGDDGARLEAGVYWARFEAAGRILTRRVTLLH